MSFDIFCDILEYYKITIVGIFINIIITIPLSLYISKEWSLFSLTIILFISVDMYLKYVNFSLKKYIFEEVRKDAEEKFIKNKKTEKIVVIQQKKFLCKNKYRLMTVDEMKTPVCKLIMCKSMFLNNNYSVTIPNGAVYFRIDSYENKDNIYHEVVYNPTSSKIYTDKGTSIIFCS